jgi:hypothetical protein
MRASRQEPLRAAEVCGRQRETLLIFTLQNLLGDAAGIPPHFDKGITQCRRDLVGRLKQN